MDTQNISRRGVKHRRSNSPAEQNELLVRKKVDIPDDTWLEALKFLTCPQWSQNRYVCRQIDGIAQRNICRLPKMVLDCASMYYINRDGVLSVNKLDKHAIVSFDAVLQKKQSDQYFKNRGFTLTAPGIPAEIVLLNARAVRLKYKRRYDDNVNVCIHGTVKERIPLSSKEKRFPWFQKPEHEGAFSELMKIRKPVLYYAQFNPALNPSSWDYLAQFLKFIYHPTSYAKTSESFGLITDFLLDPFGAKQCASEMVTIQPIGTTAFLKILIKKFLKIALVEDGIPTIEFRWNRHHELPALIGPNLIHKEVDSEGAEALHVISNGPNRFPLLSVISVGMPVITCQVTIKAKADDSPKYTGSHIPSRGRSGVNNMLLDGTLSLLTKISTDACGEFLDTQQPLIERMTEEKYDVAFAEFINRCQFGIFHKIGVQTKLATSTFMVDSYQVSHFGLQPMSSYVPNLWAPSINAPYMGFYERARNLFMNIYQFKLIWWQIPKTEQDHFTRVYGPNFPSINEILKNVSLAFFNTNEFLDLPKPISNKIVYIGGVVEGKAKNLTQDFRQIIDKSKKGVVLFSFGSLADTKLLDPKIKEAFFKSFASFPEYEFIWKLELTANESRMQSIASNVHLFDWFDQRSILAHPKTAAFISHCGMNSLNEGARAGVPLIGIPLFSDQLYDAAAMKHKNFGVYVDILQAHKQEVITSALDQVLNNPSYRHNAKLIQKKLNNAPFRVDVEPLTEVPSEQLTFLDERNQNIKTRIEYLNLAQQRDLNELQLPSPAEIGFFAYYSLDVIGISILSLILFASVVFYFVGHIDNYQKRLIQALFLLTHQRAFPVIICVCPNGLDMTKNIGERMKDSLKIMNHPEKFKSVQVQAYTDSR
ncbi:UDP-glucoronosyl and UDP-glucosyl transferase domain-containing protein [Ditylenchus destructor]|uniref:glucuronosyltransferase n=1 Tax=Ditylenchus destructor TaxID=166010 RepID=A0AAD4MSI7_9BILA|nr:UDP-glucoronosyl and UDP-glucosyl transferase domain-containing protein [Ditylenchus destructor]